jgi:hypothetical protein
MATSGSPKRPGNFLCVTEYMMESRSLDGEANARTGSIKQVLSRSLPPTMQNMYGVCPSWNQSSRCLLMLYSWCVRYFFDDPLKNKLGGSR